MDELTYDKIIDEQAAEIERLKAELQQAQANRDRFATALDRIFTAIGTDWWEGEPPVEEVIKALGTNAWIPCADRMPEPGQRVLMWIRPYSYVPGADKLGAFVPMIDQVKPWHSSWDNNDYGTDEVTHWKPLTEPPQA